MGPEFLPCGVFYLFRTKHPILGARYCHTVELRTEIESLIGNSGAEAVAVGYHDIATGEEMFILPDESFHAASTMKICVLMEVFHQLEKGELRLDEPITVHNEFKSIADGSTFSSHEEEDAEHSIYHRIGHHRALIFLARPMITHSSNLAANLLVERLGADRITAFMHELGAPGLSIIRGVEDDKAYERGLNNAVTARGLTTIMAKLGRGEVVSPTASKSMIEILLSQTHRKCIPAGLPPWTKVANKPGWVDSICHDTALVSPSKKSPYALTVLTRGLPDHQSGRLLIAAISKLVYRQATLVAPQD